MVKIYDMYNFFYLENNKTMEEIFTRLAAVQDILKKFKGIDFNSADAATINDALRSYEETKTIIEKAKEISVKQFNELIKLLEDAVNDLKDLTSQRSAVAQQVANQNK